MKRAILFTLLLLCSILNSVAQIGKVGINTSTPAAMLHVKDSSVLFSSTYYENIPEYDTPPPVSGAGVRLMWYPQRQAFRAGYVQGTQWDQSNIGFLSFATGQNTRAMGKLSSAFGFNTIANGYSSMAVGVYNDPIVDPEVQLFPSTPLFIIGNGEDNINRTNAFVALKNGRIGIGTNAPAAQLHVQSENVLFKGPLNLPNSPANPPVSGAGIRMMWYVDKAALRIGQVTGTQWDKDSIGLTSLAAGFNTKAKGIASLAMGTFTQAKGQNSVALGYYTSATGVGAVASGNSTIASGEYSNAIGSETTASGNYSLAGGFQSTTSGSSNLAFGHAATASGNYAVALGYQASASSAIAIGNLANATSANSIALGISADAVGINSIAIGNSASTNHEDALAFGVSVTSSGYRSLAMGYGTIASGDYTLSSGFSTKAKGNYSFSAGIQTIAKSYNSFIIGRYNDTTSVSSTTWIENDPLLIVGNGTANNDRKSALTLLKNGKMGLGTIAPVNLLHLRAANDTINGPILSLGGTTADQAESGRIRFYEGTASTNLRGGYIHLDGAANRFHIGIHPASDNIVSNDIDAISIDRASGEVGIGTANPNYLLEVNGTAGKPGGGSWTNSSDARLKQNVIAYNDGLESILSINPVRFHYNAHSGYDTSKEYVGVIAQELQEVAPYMVNTSARILPDGSTGYLDVDNSAMTYMLINAVKEQQALIMQQQETINMLLQRIEIVEGNQASGYGGTLNGKGNTIVSKQ